MDLQETSKEKEKPKTNPRIPRKRAVLIGLNHPDPQKMKGIDVKGKMLRMKKHLMELRGFPESKITLMIEDDCRAGSMTEPTLLNIQIVLFHLVENADPGDILFVHLIAYACSKGILTADKGEPNHLPDGYLRTVLCQAVAKGRNLTMVSDCLIGPEPDCLCPQKPIPPIKDEPGGIRWLTRYIGWMQTTLSSVDLSSKEDQGKLNESSCNLPQYPPHAVVLLTPFQCHRQALTTLVDPWEDPRLREYFKKEVDYLDQVFNLPPNERTPPPEPFQWDHQLPTITFQNELFLPPPEGTNSQQTTYGGFTNAILDIIRETDGQVTNLKLAQMAKERLPQLIPGLSCNHQKHAAASFVCS